MASVSKSATIIKPLLSQSSVEARRRVMNLYRAWYREVSPVVDTFHYSLREIVLYDY